MTLRSLPPFRLRTRLADLHPALFPRIATIAHARSPLFPPDLCLDLHTVSQPESEALKELPKSLPSRDPRREALLFYEHLRPVREMLALTVASLVER